MTLDIGREQKKRTRSFMSVDELRAELGIGENAVYNLVHSEGFPALRVGRRILVNLDDFDAWRRTKIERNGA